MRRLRNHGSPRRYVHEEFGWNSRLTPSSRYPAREAKVRRRMNDARRQRARLTINSSPAPG